MADLTTDRQVAFFQGEYCGEQPRLNMEMQLCRSLRTLFPGNTSIGGDEVPTDNWKQCAKCQQRIREEHLKGEQQLESYFIRRIEKCQHA